MKRVMRYVMLICLIFLMAGCSKKTYSVKNVPNNNSVDETLQNKVKDTEDQKEKKEKQDLWREKFSLENSQNGMSQQVDYDLTVMDRNMVYATVFQLMINPDQYIGKSFKIKGNHYTVCDEVTHKYYHYVLIKDATACCAQGLEFVLEGDNQDEYPADEAEVEIIGNFETYKEEGDESLYCRLKSASMKVIN